MDVKFGKVKPSNMLASSKSNQSTALESNFFAPKLEPDGSNHTQQASSSGHRMNDYDSNILENHSYQLISDEMLKIEHKMGLLEQLLTKLGNEIDALESLGYVIQISDLKERKKKIEDELAELNKEYAQMGLSTKISGQIASAIGFKSNTKNSRFSKVKEFISKKILAKMSKKFGNSQVMKESLDKLSSINSNVDELIHLQVPYGETISRYEKLTAYLNRANVIHSQIFKSMNKERKKAQ